MDYPDVKDINDYQSYHVSFWNNYLENEERSFTTLNEAISFIRKLEEKGNVSGIEIMEHNRINLTEKYVAGDGLAFGLED